MFLSSVLLSFFFPVLPFKKYCLFCFSTLEGKDLADSYPFSPLPRPGLALSVEGQLSIWSRYRVVVFTLSWLQSSWFSEFPLWSSPFLLLPSLVSCVSLAWCSLTLSSLWLSPGLGRCSPLVGAPRAQHPGAPASWSLLLPFACVASFPSFLLSLLSLALDMCEGGQPARSKPL